MITARDVIVILGNYDPVRPHDRTGLVNLDRLVRSRLDDQLIETFGYVGILSPSVRHVKCCKGSIDYRHLASDPSCP